jgi:putative transferase (TIGR04331 family)
VTTRFLITTADETTWKKDEKVLFLGEWCKRFSRKQVWSQLDYKVFPYHWDDRVKLYEDYKYVSKVYERYLLLLSERLNYIHGVNHSARYWRIFVGPWLQTFISILYDKYCSIKGVGSAEKISLTWISNFDDYCMTPLDHAEQSKNFFHSEWHHFIYGLIIMKMEEIPFKKIQAPTLVVRQNPTFLPILGKISKSFLTRIFSSVPDKANKIAFVSCSFSRKDLAKLQISLGQVPYLINPEINLQDVSIDPNQRNKLKMIRSSNKFEQILEELIPLQVPKVHVELYPELCKKASKRFPKNVNTIVTTHGYAANEGIKAWIAQQCERGAKLAVAQHGGNIGSGLWEQFEDHQIAISDRFYTWGWKSDKGNHIQPLSPPKLVEALGNGIHSNTNGYIFWVLGLAMPSYSYRMYSAPVAHQIVEGIQDQIEFGKRVSSDVYKLLKLRPKKVKDGWEVKSILEDAGLGDVIDDSDKAFLQRLKDCRICIATDNATVFLETFALNYPTLIFWNPKYWELRPDAQPYYVELREAGILHETPKSAAEMLNKIYSNPLKWWLQRNVQEARERFCAKYASVNKVGWLQEWKTALVEISKSD